MSRRRRIYEGRAKVLFEGPEPGTLVQHFKDDTSAFNPQKRGAITANRDLYEEVDLAIRGKRLRRGLFLWGNIPLTDARAGVGRLCSGDDVRIVLVAETSAEHCLLGDGLTNEKLAKDHFFEALGRAEAG